MFNWLNFFFPFVYIKNSNMLNKKTQVKENNYSTKFACVVVQNTDKQFLLVYGKKWNCWVFPGGKLEPNETPLAAAKRELFEETNLLVKEKDLEKVGEGIFWNNWKGYFFQAKKFVGEPIVRAEEKHVLGEIKWFTAKEIEKINTSEAVKHFFKNLQA